MNNKYILLTGANGGIGKQILLLLLEKGYQVIALDISDSNLNGLDIKFIKCDISSKEEIQNAFELTKNITNNLYAIINTAGVFMMQSLIEGNEDDFHKIFDINFFGIYHLNKTMFTLLNKDSKIITITSEVARFSPQPFQAYYNLTKITLDRYMDVLRRECNYLGIKVIKIQCGSMATKMVGGVNQEFQLMVDNSQYFKEPLTKLKYMMDREIKKQHDPKIVANKIVKVLEKKHPHIVYRIKNSGALSFVGHLPEKSQDDIYLKVIK